MASYFLTILDLILLVQFHSTLGFHSECDNSENFPTTLSKRSGSLGYGSNNVTLESGLRYSGDGRGFEKPPLPLPTEILDELFGRRLFNTTMNYIVPLFHVLLPLHTDTGSTVHLAMQAFLGLFSAIAWIATIAIPVMLTELQPFGFSRQSSNFGTFSTEKFRSLFTDETARKIGLEWDPCVCKTVCEAHRDPKRYGIFALPFRILFPPLSPSMENNWENGSSILKLIQNRQAAAWNGLHSDADCGKTYHCFFDVLDLITYLYSLI